MTLRDALMIVARRWWVVVLLMVIAGGSTYVLSKRQTPIYRSTQLVLVQPSRSDFGLTEASRLLLNPLVVYLDSSRIAAKIIDDLQLPYTPQQLMESKTIAPDTLRMVSKTCCNELMRSTSVFSFCSWCARALRSVEEGLVRDILFVAEFLVH